MASTMASAGRDPAAGRTDAADKNRICESLCRLTEWLEANDYQGYDTFDGLNAFVLRPLTFDNRLLRTVLQQAVRRFPVNMRPALGIKKSHSSKAMGFLARGFMRLYEATGNTDWHEKAKYALHWLVGNQSRGYSGACWGNHFDYQSRTFYLPRGTPTVVWTSLIGHAFLDAYDHFKDPAFLKVATSSCEHIINDLDQFVDGDGVCISYVPDKTNKVHNANTLAASLLARTYRHTRNAVYRSLAEKAMQYTAQYQRADGSWYYGEDRNLHWVDNFHTAYVLDCFKHYHQGTDDDRFLRIMMDGYHYWKKTFFLADGTPRYYSSKTLPIDIQCSSQAIDTLVLFQDRDPESLALAQKVAHWTITNMQDPSGYFYYRRYSSWLVNKTPTLHWGQSTMFCALAGLYASL